MARVEIWKSLGFSGYFPVIQKIETCLYTNSTQVCIFVFDDFLLRADLYGIKMFHFPVSH